MVTLSTFALLAAAAVGQTDALLLDFTAAGCGPCQQMKPALQQLRSQGYPIREVDVDRQQDLARHYRVTRVPTYVLVSGGREVGRVEGAVAPQQLAAMFARVRRPPARGAAPAAGVAPTIQFDPNAGLPGPPPAPRSQVAAIPAPAPAPAPALPVPPRPAPTAIPAPQPAPAAATPMAANIALDTAPRARPFTAAGVAPAAQAPAAQGAAEQRAMNATVRLKVKDNGGFGFATGTIIDVHGPEVLVLTCGHVFKHSQGRGEITIDTYYPGGPKQIRGRIVAWEVDKHDVGLVSFQPSKLPAPVRLAPGKTYRKRDLVFTLGCSKGADPTLQMTRIVSIDRYHGASNIEIAGEPVDGRSGGGLFNDKGELIGVCNAADPTDHEGIYAALPAIHDHLAMNGMRHLTGGQQLVSAPAAPAAASPNLPARMPELASLPAAAPRPATGPVPVTPISHNASAEQMEVIVVVRPSNGQGPGRVLNIRRPSRTLMQQLQRESSALPANAVPTGAVYSARELTPVVRGQDRR